MKKQVIFAAVLVLLNAFIFLAPNTNSISEEHNITISLLYSGFSPETGTDYSVSALSYRTVAGIVLPENPNSIIGTAEKLSANYNEKAYVVYTKGNAETITNRMALVRGNTFNTVYNPSFAFPIAEKNTIEIGSSYDTIRINGKETLYSGTHRLLINNNGITGGKTILVVRLE